MNIQKWLKQKDDGFDQGECYEGGRCDICEGERIYYPNKYDDNYQVWRCEGCGNEGESMIVPSSGDNICPICGEFVRYIEGDSDEYNYAVCKEAGCEQKVHISCLADIVEKDYVLDLIKLHKSWYCDEHIAKEKILKSIRAGITSEFRLYHFLKRKNIVYIYHANSVRTACFFLANQGIMSRGAVESVGGDQTPQKTDQDDKTLGIWCDIFFDSVDIHEYLSSCQHKATCINLYGPVLFKYRLEAILDLDILSSLKITKTNPDKWIKENNGNTNFFEDMNELKSQFCKNDFGQHFVLKNQRGKLGFRFLDEIIIDDPQIKDECSVDVFSQAKGALLSANQLGRGDDKINFIRRSCLGGCICNKTYSDLYRGNRKKFNVFFIP